MYVVGDDVIICLSRAEAIGVAAACEDYPGPFPVPDEKYKQTINDRVEKTVKGIAEKLRGELQRREGN